MSIDLTIEGPNSYNRKKLSKILKNKSKNEKKPDALQRRSSKYCFDNRRKLHVACKILNLNKK